MNLRAFGLIILALASPAVGLDVQEMVRQGDMAAREDRHEEAVRRYEEAIAIEPSLRPVLLHKLGRQYLWWDKSETAALLFAEALQEGSQDCELRMDLGMALSWSSQEEKAADVYRETREACPGMRVETLLGEARALRWRDRTLEADVLYRIAEQEGDAGQKAAARLGLALNLLARDQNQAAREAFRTLAQVEPQDSAVAEGLAVSSLRLGMSEESRQIVHTALENKPQDRTLGKLHDYLQRLPRPVQRTTLAAFHDADDTNYWGAQLSLSYEVNPRTQMNVLAGNSLLTSRVVGKTKEISGLWGGLGIERRFDEFWVLRGEGKLTRYAGADFRPWTGEIGATWTPRDAFRIDLAAARIVIFDNRAALQNKLWGDFMSGGFDWRFSSQNWASVSVDATHWSTDNLRMRYRFGLRHQFQGVPRLTVDWRTMFQTYDRGFPFALFSPERYVETGPSINVSGRFRQYWTYSLETRIGTLKESQGDWQPLGSLSAILERELWQTWGMQLGVSYSSSNISSSSGYQRVSSNFAVQYRF